jgi:hypothetical protein
VAHPLASDHRTAGPVHRRLDAPFLPRSPPPSTCSACTMLSLNSQPSPAATAVYLRTLPAIRERCARVHALAAQDKLQYFTYHPDKEAAVAEFCDGLIARDFGAAVDSVRARDTYNPDAR